MSLSSQPFPALGGLTLGSRAEALKRAAGEGRAEPLLKGMNVGLLCDHPDSPVALLVYRAALELGAHVSLVRPMFDEPQAAGGIASTARMLGRLYDAILCVGLEPARAQQLREFSGVPVLEPPCGSEGDERDDGFATVFDGHDDQRFLWQAALLGSFG